MKRKYFYLYLYISTIVFIIGLIVYGSILRLHYLESERYQKLGKLAAFFAEIPSNFNFIVKNRTIDGDIIEPLNNGFVYKNKNFFEKKLLVSTYNQDELILVSRYDGNINKPIVEIRDLNNFKVLHSYLPNIKKIYEKIDFSKIEFNNLKKEKGYNRFFMQHPEITSNGELIFQSDSPLVKIDFNSDVMWVNNQDIYHHSINTDLAGNIYVPSRIVPFSEKLNKYVKAKEKPWDTRYFLDDAISILSKNGKLLYSKSIAEIFIEHRLVHRIFSQADYNRDPIHLNDIQPVLKDSPFFKKGDLFLSLRNLSMIMLYRPSTNKIVRIIEGNFFNQHDIDILDDKRISIYNNNSFSNSNQNSNVENNNEIIIYNFETNTFEKKFEDTFEKNKINTIAGGLIDFLSDGSSIIEDYDNGRIFHLNYKGEVVWEFNNLDKKKRKHRVFWARIIDIDKSKKLLRLIKNKKK